MEIYIEKIVEDNIIKIVDFQKNRGDPYKASRGDCSLATCTRNIAFKPYITISTETKNDLQLQHAYTYENFELNKKIL